MKEGGSREAQAARAAGEESPGESGPPSGLHAQLLRMHVPAGVGENVSPKTELQGTKASVVRSLLLQPLSLYSCLFWKPVAFSSAGTPSPPLTESEFRGDPTSSPDLHPLLPWPRLHGPSQPEPLLK